MIDYNVCHDGNISFLTAGRVRTLLIQKVKHSVMMTL